MINTQLAYRTNFRDNNNIHIGLARYRGDNFKDFHFGFAYDYDKLSIADNET